MDDTIFSALIDTNAPAAARAQVCETLQKFDEPALRCAIAGGIKVHVLKSHERYDTSVELRRLKIDVDAWPAPPAGLFVVSERTMILRSCSPMTVSHEFGHAIDCALGRGLYYSGSSHEIRAAFATARSFVTPYAATGLDEYFAEALRAWVGANDPASAWPAVSRERLQRLDAAMFAIVSAIFQRFATT